MTSKRILSIVLALTFGIGVLRAQETPKPSGLSEEELKKANDPMANTKALNMQKNLYKKLKDSRHIMKVK
jgi:hypothetical protein